MSGWEESLSLLPDRVALGLLEAAYQPGASARLVVLALSRAPDDASFRAWCDRLGLSPPATCPELDALLIDLAEGGAWARVELLAAAALAWRGPDALAALHLAASADRRGDGPAARAALARASAEASPGVRARLALERWVLDAPEGETAEQENSAETAAAILSDASRWELTPRDRLHVARLALARAPGRYARVEALDVLLELAVAGGPLARACLRVALEHADARGPALSPLEIDRIRTLRDRVRPSLSLGPPFEPRSAAQRELSARAEAALRGEVRGPLPLPSSAEHGESLALDALAHVLAGRDHAALERILALRTVSPLPHATWALLLAAKGVRLRRASAPIALTAARTLPLPRIALLPLAIAYEGVVRRTLLIRALDRGEPGAEEALASEVEAAALALRDAGRREDALRLVEALEPALAGDPAAREHLGRASE